MTTHPEHPPVVAAEVAATQSVPDVPQEAAPYVWSPLVAPVIFIALVSLYVFLTVEAQNATPTYTWGDEAVSRFFAQHDPVKLPVFFVILTLLAYGASNWRKSRT
jgi:hypothetical protein